MKNYSRKPNFLLLVLMIAASSLLVFPQDKFWQNTNSSLIRIGDDQPQKIPLILIHGINGTKPDDEIGKVNSYWNQFRSVFRADLQEKYSLFVFQYYSHKVEVFKIGLELRDLIDENLADRNHVILAHSMGGLVAKSYMTETHQGQGKWKGKTGGDTTIGIITLATPHHGTPGANSPQTLEKYFATLWYRDGLKPVNLFREGFELAQQTYWKGSAGETHPSVTDSGIWNRSDLRWDNYDGKWKNFEKDWDKVKGDINKSLADRNFLFQRYNSKLIAYAGYLDSEFHPANTIEFLIELKKHGKDKTVKEDPHRLLTLANFFLVYGLDKNFGHADGNVPFKSGLFCNFEQQGSWAETKNYVCKSPSRVRRFEPGEEGLVFKNEYPDANTLSIYKTQRGFDHLDMLEDRIVLGYVIRDLRDFDNLSKVKQPPVIPVAPEIPTLFLFDVSGSMLENGKIEQARKAGLRALDEMKENRRLGRDNSTVSIWVFSGGCQPNTARQILPFTANLAQVENAMRSSIPKPDGGTPLPQAIEKSGAQINDYLSANPNVNLGRLVVLSDGQSTCGEIRPAGIYSQAKVTIFNKVNILTVGYDIQVGSQAERDLQYLASASGGRYFPASNGRQLSRAFEKAIRVYLPKTVASPNTDFERGVQAILNRDFSAAVKVFANYTQANPADALGYYNLAVACEASELYKRATENYRKYLSLAPGEADANEIRTRIEKTEEDYRAKLIYQAELLRSDLEYLKAYYERLFGLKNAELAAEFAGFVYEKRAFYANLPENLEIKSSWLRRSSEELNDSLGRLNNRVNSPSFDRDAVSLLTLPIGQLEELVEKLDEYNAQNFR